ncbi:Mycothiol maleylpyruvate isomerase N-terminal domain-containing protein [Actinopolyspora xinjiangensis]|uniref:Mycothiol maleylpyruvate isomerase N-terminal domain-containing protein n=1 Tax=Actinopolyspora xinjiangensis TaxID=405564 RepID=A0A1H0SRR7_9ACTN|nr:maleylpyruvate isomerase N-terminal domain-containing protein [Actinopolyspora xinjiangensis]SDP43916.1 Mycothiol maleylpyruvate isomerase N-terminal domain-containing protein [Actinopolyspora xinjiangensis]
MTDVPDERITRRKPFAGPPAGQYLSGRGSLLTLLDGVTHGGHRPVGRGFRDAVRLHRLAGSDLACHLIIDAQDGLITLVTPAEAEPTRDTVTYWEVTGTPPTGDDPLDALTVRLAAAYGQPWLLRFHLDDIGSAAGRAAELADPAARVSTRDEVLTAGDYLAAYVVEWTLHHLDLIAHLPHVPGPPPEGLARTRETLESIAGTPLPTALSDTDALLLGTGRRLPTDAERAELGELATRLPFVLG